MNPAAAADGDRADPADVLERWLAAMFAGDFEAAWQQTDRIEMPRRASESHAGFQRAPEQLVWNGAPFAGRRVLIRCEHGLGDTIQFLRYVPLVRAVARSVIVKVQPALLSLFREMPGIDLLLDAWTTDPDPPHDVAIECMELAYAFRSTVETLPAEVPYLPVERLRAESKIVLPESDGSRVGVIWASSSWNATRSVPLADFAPLAEVPNARFFSLQQGSDAAKAAHAPFPLIDLSPQTADVAQAAAAMLQLDLIITIDSMPAHLAGALGRPVWLLLQHDADWRWQRTGETSPWYPSMRIFRQPEPGNWPDVMLRVQRALSEGEFRSGG